ncbi:hypothetical protein [Pseudalkalibacillus caeni]|uniref:Uncharacterized protein n=1 Tax=Exobacillus caeni TaxID=2574798 RepID=A0A5R9F2I0_9BACL|nr:hypothetical protein [Pseudalkalibacillus caeni]TLS35718.1 hypothetical protein FCL54_18855 [Pseudalkalibacillus caeni]
MRKNEVIYNGELTGTIGEKNGFTDAKNQFASKEQFIEEFGEEFAPIQQTWRVNPADEEDYKGTLGYKDA